MKLLEETVYRKRCDVCEALFEYHKGEEVASMVTCPVCGSEYYWSDGDPFVIKHNEETT